MNFSSLIEHRGVGRSSKSATPTRRTESLRISYLNFRCGTLPRSSEFINLLSIETINRHLTAAVDRLSRRSVFSECLSAAAVKIYRIEFLSCELNKIIHSTNKIVYGSRVSDTQWRCTEIFATFEDNPLITIKMNFIAIGHRARNTNDSPVPGVSFRKSLVRVLSLSVSQSFRNFETTRRVGRWTQQPEGYNNKKSNSSVRPGAPTRLNFCLYSSRRTRESQPPMRIGRVYLQTASTRCSAIIPRRRRLLVRWRPLSDVRPLPTVIAPCSCTGTHRPRTP